MVEKVGRYTAKIVQKGILISHRDDACICYSHGYLPACDLCATRFSFMWLSFLIASIMSCLCPQLPFLANLLHAAFLNPDLLRKFGIINSFCRMLQIFLRSP
ncbi:hypothetical protein D1007_47678 [Hordeum vulgare]|nr:hypothetical protein D1007_47678 [Hordeum vulgare]